MAQPEGAPEPDQTMIVDTAHMLRVLGKLPGGLADADAVRLAAMAHGLTIGTEGDTAVGAADFPARTAESHPYPAGQGYAADGAAQANLVRAGEQDGWPTRGWAAETAFRGHPAHSTGARDIRDQDAAGILGAPLTEDTGVVDKWAVPAGAYTTDLDAAEFTRADGSLVADGKRRQPARAYHPERRNGFRLGARSLAVLSAAALAAVLAGGAAFVDHKRHVDFNHSVQATVSVPDYIPLGTEARTILAGDVDAIQQALVDPAISADSSNSLQANRLYNQRLGALPMAILLQVGGGDPKTTGYPGVIWPLPPQVYEQDYQALVTSEKAHGEAVSPNDPSDPATDARVVAIDMNRFFEQHFPSGDMPSISALARAYGAYEATLLGAPRKGASDFGQSTANLVTQWDLTQAQYLALPAGSRQFAALAKDPTWLAHEGAIANRGIK